MYSRLSLGPWPHADDAKEAQGKLNVRKTPPRGSLCIAVANSAVVFSVQYLHYVPSEGPDPSLSPKRVLVSTTEDSMVRKLYCQSQHTPVIKSSAV